MSHDVLLEKGRKPEFPDVCVVCASAGPGGLARISTDGFAGEAAGMQHGAAKAERMAAGASDHSLFVPACPACARALERRHRLKKIALYGGVVAGLAWFALALFGLGMLGLALGGLALGIFAPVVWDLASPPSFTAYPNRGMMIYEFRNLAAAQAFAERNGGRVV